MATLELRNLHKSYGSGLADTLRDIRLKIDSGEFLILVGPSGCGKSTLMNCIAGLESITGGAILVDGQDILRIFRPKAMFSRTLMVGYRA